VADRDGDGVVHTGDCVEFEQRWATMRGRATAAGVGFDRASCTQRWTQAAAAAAAAAAGECDSAGTASEGFRCISAELFVATQLAQTPSREFTVVAAEMEPFLRLLEKEHEQTMACRRDLETLMSHAFQTLCDYDGSGLGNWQEVRAFDQQVCVAEGRSFDARASERGWREMAPSDAGVTQQAFVRVKLREVPPQSYGSACETLRRVFQEVAETRSREAARLRLLLGRVFAAHVWSADGLQDATEYAQTVSDLLQDVTLFKPSPSVNPRRQEPSGARCSQEDFVDEFGDLLSPEKVGAAVTRLERVVRLMEAEHQRRIAARVELRRLFGEVFSMCNLAGAERAPSTEFLLFEEQVCEISGEPFHHAVSAAKWASLAQRATAGTAGNSDAARDDDSQYGGLTLSKDEYVEGRMLDYGPGTWQEGADRWDYIVSQIDDLRSRPPSGGGILLLTHVAMVGLVQPAAEDLSKVQVSIGLQEHSTSYVKKNLVSLSADAAPIRILVPHCQSGCTLHISALQRFSQAELGHVSIRLGHIFGTDWTRVSTRRTWQLWPGSTGTFSFVGAFIGAAALRPPEGGLLRIRVEHCSGLLRTKTGYCADLRLGHDRVQHSGRSTYSGNASGSGQEVFQHEFRCPVAASSVASLDDFMLQIAVSAGGASVPSAKMALDVGTLLGKGWEQATYSGSNAMEPAVDDVHIRTAETAHAKLTWTVRFMPASLLRPPCDGMLLVRLHRCTALRAADKNGLSDPFVQLILGQRQTRPQQSRVLKETLEPIYLDEYRWPVSARADISEQCLRLTVKDKDALGKDDFLGFLELDVGAHLGEGWSESLVAHTFPLSPDENENEVETQTGLQPFEPCGNVELSLEFFPLASLIPPSSGLVIVRLLRCERLLPADSNGLSDPFVTFTLGPRCRKQPTLRSRVISECLNPCWGGDEFRFEVSTQMTIEELRMRAVIQDRDRLRNDTLGSLELELGRMFDGGWGSDAGADRWFVLGDREGRVPAQLVTTALDVGGAKPQSVYGRVQLGCRFIPEAVLRPPCDGLVLVTLCSCDGLLAADSNGLSDPRVHMALGQTTHTSRVIPKTLAPVWGDVFRFAVSAKDPLEQLRLSLDVEDKDMLGSSDALGSIELDMGALLGQRWGVAVHDRVFELSDAAGKVKKPPCSDSGAVALGRVRLGLSFVPGRALRPPSAGLVMLRVLQADGLLAADRNGLSDPYVQLTVGSQKSQRTKVVKKSLTPVWEGEQFSFKVAHAAAANFDDCLMTAVVKDHDVLSDDVLGVLEVDLGPSLGKDWGAQNGWFTQWFVLGNREGKVGANSDATMKLAGSKFPYGRLQLGLQFVPVT
jgi:hypothetical protein